MQKLLIVLVVGLLAVGCGQSDTERLEQENRRLKAQIENGKLKAELEAETDNAKKEPPANSTEQNTAKAKTVRESTPEQKQEALKDSVVGEYEHKYEDGYKMKYVFLKNGNVEWHSNDKNIGEEPWTIENGEIRISTIGLICVYRINPDKSITEIALIEGKKRTDRQKDKQLTWKKIK